MNNIILNIDINKYPLLNKINTEYLNIVLSDIFENGYNNYVIGLLKNNNNFFII